LAKAEHLFIKLGCLLQIVDFNGDVNDTRHAVSSLQKFNCVSSSGKAAAALLISAMISRRLTRFPQEPTIAGQI
jgi:hypothetical protein